MAVKKIKLSTINPNPANPRLIKDDRFQKLCNSIEQFPKMMELRPIVIDDNSIILGGNMRYKALLHLKYKEVPETWIKRASDLTDEEKKRFVIADNVELGEHDWDIIANEWSDLPLEEWGLEISKGEKGYFQQQLQNDFDENIEVKLPYPITIVVNESDYKKWQKLKEKYKELNDLKLFLTLLKEINP